MRFPYQIPYDSYWSEIDPTSLSEEEIDKVSEEMPVKGCDALLKAIIADASAIPGYVGVCLIAGGAHGYVIQNAIVQLDDGTTLRQSWSDLPDLISGPDARKVDLDLREELLRLRGDGTILRGAINKNMDRRSGIAGRVATVYLAAGSEAEWFRLASPLLNGEYPDNAMNRLFVATIELADQIALV